MQCLHLWCWAYVIVSFYDQTCRIYLRRIEMRFAIGISLQNIKTFILHNYPGVDPNTLKVQVSKALEDCMANGLIRKPDASAEKPTELGNKFLTLQQQRKSCARGDTVYASALCKLTISSYLFARWHLFRHVGCLRHQQVDF